MQLKQRSKGGVWYAHFTGAQGERLRLSTGTADATEAQLKALELMREHLVDKLPEEDRRKHGNLETLSGMLRQAWHVRWQHLKSNREVRLRIGRLARDIGHWPRGACTTKRLREHFDTMTTGKHNPKPISNASKNRYISCIHTAFSIAQEDDSTLVLPKFPHWPENNVKERYVTTEEEQRILQWFERHTAPADTQRQYLWDLFVVLIDSGMRCNEALSEMAPEALVPLSNGRHGVHLRHGCTKSGKGRVVPLTPRALEAAKRMFQSPHHWKTSSNNAGRQWRHVTNVLSISGVNLHVLRHTCASRLVQQGVDLYQVSIWLGHSSMEVTRRYAHLAPNTLSGALAALEAAAVPNVPASEAIHPVVEAHPPHSGTQNRVKLSVVR